MTEATLVAVEALDPPDNLGLHAAMQKRKDVEDPRPVAGAAMTFDAEMSIVERDGRVDFRGPYVQGPRGDRFIYLVWLRDSGGSLERVSRSKIILDEIPDDLVQEARTTPGARLIASFEATSPTGGPLTGRVRPDVVSWRVARP